MKVTHLIFCVEPTASINVLGPATSNLPKVQTHSDNYLKCIFYKEILRISVTAVA